MRIAILEDDPAEAALAHHILSGAGHACERYGTGAELIAALGEHQFDLLVLDWVLPDTTGYEVVSWVRSHLSAQVMVLFLSNRALEENIVLALMAGGDDYMIKPARRAELVARVHALSRRLSVPATGTRTVAADSNLEVGAYRFNRVLKRVSLHGEQIDLKPKEFDIAFVLFRNIGGIVSREKLTEEVWGRDLVMTSRTLDTHMSNVRSKLALKPENQIKLTTIYTLGYRLDYLGGEEAALIPARAAAEP